MGSEAIDRLAKWLLEHLGFDARPPIPIEGVAIALGVDQIHRLPLVEDGRLEQRGGCTTIFLRDDVPMTRQRFTLAHELGHLVLAGPERELVARRMGGVRFSSEERFCDQFAAALLMPSEWIRSEFTGAASQLGIARNLAERSESSLSASVVRLREVLGWQTSLLHWRRYEGRWRMTTAAALPRGLHNQVTSSRETRLVLERLAGCDRDLRGILPLAVRGQAWRVPVEIAVSHNGAVAMASFSEAMHDSPH